MAQKDIAQEAEITMAKKKLKICYYYRYLCLINLYEKRLCT